VMPVAAGTQYRPVSALVAGQPHPRSQEDQVVTEDMLGPAAGPAGAYYPRRDPGAYQRLNDVSDTIHPKLAYLLRALKDDRGTHQSQARGIPTVVLSLHIVGELPVPHSGHLGDQVSAARRE